MNFIAELKRRNVIRMAGLYLVGAWLIVQVSGTVLPMFGAPDWLPRSIVILVAIGFVPTLIFSWVFELTPGGIKRDAEVKPDESIAPQTAQRMNRMIIAVLVLALTYFGFDKFVLAPRREATQLVQAAKSSAQHAAQAVQAINKKSIAVLPFTDLSPGHDQDYFSDGMSEEILNALAQVKDLKVAGRTSSFYFKGKNEDLRTIGKTLGVANILEGSVRKQGDKVRITAQLIQASDGFHLWSDSYDGDLKDVFALQEKIAGAIADALEAKLGGRPVAAASARTANPAAYDDYLQGRAFVARRRVENLDKAIAAFDRAIAQDPGYSAAHSGRAYAALLRPLWSATDFAASLMQARSSAEKALQLDPDNAEAYMVRGLVAEYSNDFTAAGANFDRALSLASGNVDVLNMAGDFRLSAGDLVGAEHAKRQAMALDPLAFVHPMNLSDALSAQGRYPEAIVAVEQAIALGAGEFGYDRLVFFNARLKRFDAAQAALDKGCALDPTSVAHCGLNRVLLLAVQGQRSQAELKLDAIARETRKETLSPVGVSASAMPAMYLEAGDIAKATQWQQTAVDVGDWFPTSALLSQPGGAKLPEEISRDPGWLAVWSDPRLKDVMTNYRRNLLAWRACSKTGTTCP